jgi:predicted membrane-bound mannosyltransferase/DNA-binding beta-propeller fold protein YncE
MTTDNRSDNWLERLLSVRVDVNAETIIFAGILVVAVLTRFYDLETRVMSHDESLHTFYSWELAEGRGFQHTPLMHGPLQFHMVALSYFLFGDSDASARIPAALAGVAAIAIVWVFRRWFGKTGAIVTAVLMLISPFMLYYSRYVRNEIFVVLLALLMFWAVFRYFETRGTRWLYLLAVTLALHFATKETAFLYTAQMLIFLAGMFVWRLYNERWRSEGLRRVFLTGALLAIVGTGFAIVTYFQGRSGAESGVIQPLDPGAEILPSTGLSPVIAAGALLAIAGLAMIAVALIREFGRRLRTDFPTLDLLVVIGTLTLPHLAAIPADFLGWDPLAYQDPASFWPTIGVLLVLLAISLAIGFAWDIRRWLPIAGAFFLPFLLFYTTLFTNPNGVATGLVGSLGYWLVQHGVERGSQPSYYYALIQLPFYEFLPVVGALLALAFGVQKFRQPRKQKSKSEDQEEQARIFPVVPFFGYWAITSFIGYSFAGERMPWLTVHIALPLIFLAGWAFGRFIESVNWTRMKNSRGWLLALLVLVLVVSTTRALGYLLGPEAPFQGSTLDELRVTNGFLAAAGVAIGSLIAIVYLRRNWSMVNVRQMAGVIVLAILAFLTLRTAFRASYINFDNATEFMVYAHSATGVKNVLDQVEDLSRRTTDGLSIRVAFDDDVSWPINWYLRNYDEALYYGPSPSRDLLNYPVVITGDNNWAKVDPLMQDRYHSFEYIRMWWPMQDYFNLDAAKLGSALNSPEMRGALWDIWLNRDYDAYGEVTGRDYSLENWSPADRMRLYIRKDIGSLIWDYGVTAAELEAEPYVDPYADRMTTLSAGVQFGGPGEAPGQLSGPRGLAIAPSGELYVADAMNHRVQRFSADGLLLGEWGTFAAAPEGGEAPPGTFNEPWDVAVGPDGTVYVADTWNHRVQRFTADGEHLSSFGSFGQTGEPTAFWGPRAIAVDDDGRVFVTDTGNKRVVIFDAEGFPLGQFGGFGLELGGLDEPVGIDVDKDGRVYVADTWNQRIQVFEELGEGSFAAVAEWPVDGWLGQSLENKPYLRVRDNGDVCVSDPEGYRILCFDSEGEFSLGWGTFGGGDSQFGLPIGLAFSDAGVIWVADGANNRIMQFQLPGDE